MLSVRALNRSLLARQMLLQRADIPALEAIEHLVGMQAQVPGDPYIGLWTRLRNFSPEHLSTPVRERSVVRASLMRATIHLVTARDYPALRAVIQPVLERNVHGGVFGGKRLAGVDLGAVLEEGRSLLTERPRTNAELRQLLGGKWPLWDAESMAFAVRMLLPSIHVPPRGVWGASGPIALTTAQAWLGTDVDRDQEADDVVRRYLAAFGPATVADIRTWSGLSGVRDVVERIRPGLQMFRDERGREIFDLQGAPFPDPETPAPPRFLPEYDNVLLSHADRSRIIPDRHRLPMLERRSLGTVLVDGFARATWRITRQGRGATLSIQPPERLSGAEQRTVEEEGVRLLDFAASDAETRDVAFVIP